MEKEEWGVLFLPLLESSARDQGNLCPPCGQDRREGGWGLAELSPRFLLLRGHPVGSFKCLPSNKFFLRKEKAKGKISHLLDVTVGHCLG